MEREQLREHLEQLVTAIDKLQASEQDKDRLNSLVVDIERQLDDDMVEQEPRNLADEVETLVSSFEAEHPTLAGILNNIMITLSSMGV